MLDKILNWLSDFFANRQQHELDLKICNSCEALKILLEQEKEEKRKLLDAIIQANSPREIEHEDTDNHVPIHSAPISWKVRRQKLEAESLAKKKELDLKKQMEIESKKSTEQLEKELLADA